MPTPQELMALVNKTVGKDVMKMGDDAHFVTNNIPTGVAPIDYLTRGGLPRNRMTEIYGDFSTLKSYIGLRAIANAQRLGYTCALVDTEHAYDSAWARSLGINTADLILEHPSDGETAFDSAELLLRAGLDLLVFDSVAATLPKSERETKISEKSVQPARLAALMSLGLRKLTAANQGGTALLWINQTRTNIGVSFGNPETVPGGKALPFYASWRISLRKAGNVTKESHVFDGSKMKAIKQRQKQTIRAFTEKAKLDRPYNEVYFDFDLSTASIDELGFLINVGMEKGFITRGTGGVWQLQGGDKVRGLEKFRATLNQSQLEGMIFQDLDGKKPLPKLKGVRKKRVS